jgi:hypothetical protein
MAASTNSALLDKSAGSGLKIYKVDEVEDPPIQPPFAGCSLRRHCELSTVEGTFS